MASRVCWNCKVNTHMTEQGPQSRRIPDDTWFVVTRAYACDNCRALSLGSAVANSFDVDFGYGDDAILANRDDELQWQPVLGVGKEFLNVPQYIASAASEAFANESISSHRSAILMARSVLEATAKDKGITQGYLDAKINKMHSDRLIGDVLHGAAHEIRHLGNDMAHGDFVEDTTQEEAEEVLEFMSQVLAEVYQRPSLVAKRRAAREAKKAGAQP